jgi:hypothetical protein
MVVFVLKALKAVAGEGSIAVLNKEPMPVIK